MMAIKGFTYAYVETNEIGAFLKSQVYATNPIKDPNMIKYKTLRKDLDEMDEMLIRENSPVVKLNINNPKPPARNSIPVLNKGEFGIFASLLNMDPKDQKMAANKIVTSPNGLIL